MKKSRRSPVCKSAYHGPEVPASLLGGKTPRKYSKAWLQMVKLTPFCLLASESDSCVCLQGPGNAAGKARYDTNGVSLWHLATKSGQPNKLWVGVNIQDVTVYPDPPPAGCNAHYVKTLSYQVTYYSTLWPVDPSGNHAGTGNGKPWTGVGSMGPKSHSFTVHISCDGSSFSKDHGNDAGTADAFEYDDPIYTLKIFITPLQVTLVGQVLHVTVQATLKKASADVQRDAQGNPVIVDGHTVHLDAVVQASADMGFTKQH